VLHSLVSHRILPNPSAATSQEATDEWATTVAWRPVAYVGAMAVKDRSLAVDRTRVLANVLCGVDGTRSSYEAVRQAASLAAPDGRLTLLAVTGRTGSGRYQGAALAPMRARRALDRARRLARENGVNSSPELVDTGPVVDVVLDRAREHGLLALGAPSMSRLAHLLIGGIATVAAHNLPCALLVVRRRSADSRFNERILVASDALSRSDALVDFAADLAQVRQASLILLHVASSESAIPARIVAQTERVRRTLGSRSHVRVEPGRAYSTIVETAAQEGASLIVLASRRVSGLRALGSVSERVVHGAPCSILALRPEDLRA
jgi:nucleotide-binding universal stress UspA family protein